MLTLMKMPMAIRRTTRKKRTRCDEADGDEKDDEWEQVNAQEAICLQ